MDMNCRQVRIALENQAGVTAGADASIQPELLEHLQGCELCRHRHADTMVRLNLAEAAPTEPRLGFVDDVIQTAIHRGERSSNTRLAMAAAVAIMAIAAGLLFNPTLDDRIPNAYEVAVAPHLEKVVDVIVDSVADREAATLTIALADNVQLKGFENERVVSWETPLREGKNLLQLPVILTNDDDGQFEVGLSYGDTRKTITVIVMADGDSPAVRV